MELNELIGEKDHEMRWKERARWIKFEEDVEEETERWGKPHVASLSFRSLLELRRTITHGTAAHARTHVTHPRARTHARTRTRERTHSKAWFILLCKVLRGHREPSMSHRGPSPYSPGASDMF